MSSRDHATHAGALCTRGTDDCCIVCGVAMTRCRACRGVGYHRAGCVLTDGEVEERTSRGRYVECTWFFVDRNVILSGRVDGDEIRCFAAETEDGEPFLIPDAFMSDALTDLIEATR